VDAKPIIAGHTLVAPKAHVPSVADLGPLDQAQLRIVQREVSRRLCVARGEAGAYEHGRSALCRFHAADRGHIHAHVHVVPVSFDLIGQTEAEAPSEHISLPFGLPDGKRYLYQETGPSPNETWALAGWPIKRHVVRSELQRELSRRGVEWIAVDADAATLDDAEDETTRLLGRHGRRSGIIEIVGPSFERNQAVASLLRNELRWPFSESDRFEGAVTLDRDDSTSVSPPTIVVSGKIPQIAQEQLPMRVWMRSADGSSNDGQAVSSSKVADSDGPSWGDVRLNLDTLSDEQLARLVHGAWVVQGAGGAR